MGRQKQSQGAQMAAVAVEGIQRKKRRGYNTREAILINGRYNPLTDLKKDWQGLYKLVLKEPRQFTMKNQLRKYLRARNEDSLDLT